MRFGIIDRGDVNSKEVSKRIKDACIEHEWEFSMQNPDLIISVGGDGTMLRSIHAYINQLDQISFVGVHTGTLGFFTDYTQSEINLFLNDLFTRKPKIEAFPMLEIDLPEKEEKFYAFNEVRIETIGKTLSLDVYIDNEFFENTTGSGLCISTQFGSTAVNRALAGAVVDSGIQVMQLCEIMPIAHNNHHSLRNPYIMRQDRKIRIKGDFTYAKGCYDHLTYDIHDTNELYVKTSEKKVRFARYRTYSYLRRLKNLY